MGKRGGWGGTIILASCEHLFIRVHENLVQHPSNNTSNLIFQPTHLSQPKQDC